MINLGLNMLSLMMGQNNYINIYNHKKTKTNYNKNKTHIIVKLITDNLNKKKYCIVKCMDLKTICIIKFQNNK